jgi:hypothetical protein
VGAISSSQEHLSTGFSTGRKRLCFARVYRVSGQAEPESKMGAQETKMVDFENRNGKYVLVHEYRKRRKPPFAGRHHLKRDTP